jgi:hypothetical protein
MSGFGPAFCDALRRDHPILTEAALHKAKEFNSQRYYYRGIGRYAPSAAYAHGRADLQKKDNFAAGSLYNAPELNNIEGWLARSQSASSRPPDVEALDRAIHAAVTTLNTERKVDPLAKQRISA